MLLPPTRRRRSTLGAWLDAILDIVVAAAIMVVVRYKIIDDVVSV